MNDDNAATHGIGVSGFASTPYNVAVGGTDFGDTYSRHQQHLLELHQHARPTARRKSYIPEIPWNDSCASAAASRRLKAIAVTYGTTGFCNSATGSESSEHRPGAAAARAAARPERLQPRGRQRHLRGIRQAILADRSGRQSRRRRARYAGRLAVRRQRHLGPLLYLLLSPTPPMAARPARALPAAGRRRRNLVLLADHGRHPGAGKPAQAGSTQGNPNYRLYQLAAGEYGASGEQHLQFEPRQYRRQRVHLLRRDARRHRRALQAESTIATSRPAPTACFRPPTAPMRRLSKRRPAGTSPPASAPSTSYNLVTGWNENLRTATHDFNGDGKSDIAWRDTSGDLAIWLMNGAQVFRPGGFGKVPTTWSIVGQRDFNGDGEADLLWRNTSGDMAIWFMNGTQVASSAGLGNISTNWTVVGTGDFNGDGKGDILWRDTGGDVAIWLMNGAQILSAGGIGNVPADWSVVGTGDFNGDGKSDILWRDTSGDIAIWFMNGTQVVVGRGYRQRADHLVDRRHRRLQRRRQERHSLARHAAAIRGDLADERRAVLSSGESRQCAHHLDGRRNRRLQWRRQERHSLARHQRQHCDLVHERHGGLSARGHRQHSHELDGPRRQRRLTTDEAQTNRSCGRQFPVKKLRTAHAIRRDSKDGGAGTPACR